MSEPFIAEVRIFAGNFAPRNWAFCDGQLMPISQNTTLFSLIGTIYGGDGKVTMQLPDLQGRAAMHAGSGPGLTTRYLGETSGEEAVTLVQTQIPQHNHLVETQPQSRTGVATDPSPAGNIPAAPAAQAYGTTADTAFAANMVAMAGGNAAHNNMQPYLVLAFIIALHGVFPPRG